MSMERIQDRIAHQNNARRNYIKEAIFAMVRKAKSGVEKAEENKTRTQFWLTAVMMVLMPFFSWLGLHLIETGKLQARQEYFDLEKKALQDKISAQAKEIEALKAVKINVPIEPAAQVPRTRKTQPRRNRMNGQAEIPEPRANYANNGYPAAYLQR